jgi:hypothetical protein
MLQSWEEGKGVSFSRFFTGSPKLEAFILSRVTSLFVFVVELPDIQNDVLERKNTG